MSDNLIAIYAIAGIAALMALGVTSDKAINAMALDVAVMEGKP